jgi:hypothetical protein
MLLLMVIMRRFPLILLLLLVLGSRAFAASNGEYILLVGGPSLRQWEKYKAQPHDHWWANFIRAARIRTEQLRSELGPDAAITWLVYKQGYVDRAEQENQDLISLINTVGEKFNLKMVYFRNGSDVIGYLNNGQNRERLKVSGFEYFGHSNKACFMFDYSNNIDSACKSWLHESELHSINGRVFARGALIRSWGCHTGEQMSDYWKRATGTRMIGVVGKTQYMLNELPIISSPDGRWVN